MFFKRVRWLIVSIIAFASGMLVAIQWMGSDYGMKVYDLVKRPEVVEKVVEVEVMKVVIISDDKKIQVINQEYRDALLKISAATLDENNYGRDYYKLTHQYSIEALSIPEKIYKME